MRVFSEVASFHRIWKSCKNDMTRNMTSIWKLSAGLGPESQSIQVQHDYSGWDMNWWGAASLSDNTCPHPATRTHGMLEVEFCLPTTLPEFLGGVLPTDKKINMKYISTTCRFTVSSRLQNVILPAMGLGEFIHPLKPCKIKQNYIKSKRKSRQLYTYTLYML